MSKYVTQAMVQSAKREERASAETLSWASAHPALWEFLTLDAYEDGTPREVSMLLVFVEDGRFKIALQDRQEGRSLWMVGNSLSECLSLLDGALRSGKADWRQMRSQPAKKGRK